MKEKIKNEKKNKFSQRTGTGARRTFILIFAFFFILGTLAAFQRFQYYVAVSLMALLVFIEFSFSRMMFTSLLLACYKLSRVICYSNAASIPGT
jgi:hypothetical protein